MSAPYEILGHVGITATELLEDPRYQGAMDENLELVERFMSRGMAGLPISPDDQEQIALPMRERRWHLAAERTES